MMHRLCYVLLLLCLTGCANIAAKRSHINIDMQASALINPDADGRASPVEVRLFELTSRERFEQATFYPLFLHPGQTLGDSVSRQMRLYIKPGETVQLTTDLQPGSRHLGLLIGFMDVRHSRWRALVDLADGRDISITLDANTVAMRAH